MGIFEKIKQPFYRAAGYLQEKLDRDGKLSEDIPFREQLTGALMAAAAGVLLTLLLQISTLGQSALKNGYVISRPQKGQGEKHQELVAEIEGSGQEETIDLVIGERKYTDAERAALFETALAELETEMLGENTSADEVRQKLSFPEKLADGQVTAEWTQTPAGLIDDEGFLTEEAEADLTEEGTILTVHAVLSCEGEEQIYEQGVRLLPPLYSKEEQILRALQKEIETADEKSADQEELILPKEAAGYEVTWHESKKSMLGVGLFLTIIAAAAVFAGKKREVRVQAEKRRRQLLLDYPDLLFKMSMLLNAGLTLQNAFSKIAVEYRNRQSGEIRYAYEEMLVAYYEMRSGMPEARAYENFGKRCGEAGYVKLGAMLSSNLQKGSEGLAKLLQELAASSMEERRLMAKKLGEEAGTKLLLPMMLMLLVVLIIMMVPALLAF